MRAAPRALLGSILTSCLLYTNTSARCFAAAAVLSGQPPHSRDVETVRTLLVNGEFTAAAALASAKSRQHVAVGGGEGAAELVARCDWTLAEILGGRSSASFQARIERGILTLESLVAAAAAGHYLSVQTGVLKNLAWAHMVTRQKSNGGSNSTYWPSRDRSIAAFSSVLQLHSEAVREALLAPEYDSSTSQASPLAPVTVFDIGVGGQVCRSSLLRPRNAIRCSTEDVTNHLDDDQLQRGSGGDTNFLGRLYIDTVKRALTDFLYDDNVTDWGGYSPSWSIVFRTQGFSARPSHLTRGHTTLSGGSLTQLEVAVGAIFDRNVPGDFIEAGVFRGGACIFLRALLAARGVTDRTVWVADSFAGIPESRERTERPAGDIRATVEDKGGAGGEWANDCNDWDDRYAVSEEEVRSNFERYGLLDGQVRFIAGFFNVSLPPVFGEAAPAPVPRLALVRIDADAYDGVRDALEMLYPRLSVGGMVIIDDFHLMGAVHAAHEFRERHGIEDPLLVLPSDYVYTCGVGEHRDAAAPGPAGLARCDPNQRETALYHQNMHLVHSTPPQVAFWTKSAAVP